MPINQTTPLSPASAVAPVSSNSGSPENSAIGGVFGEILNDQNQLLPQGEALISGENSLIEGGNVLQSGGKTLPELNPVEAVVTDIQSVVAEEVLESTVPAAETEPKAIAMDLVESLPVTDELLVEETAGQPALLANQLINPEVYQLAKQNPSRPLLDSDSVVARADGQLTSAQPLRPELRPDIRNQGGGLIPALGEQDVTDASATRVIFTSSEQPVAKSFLDAGIQSRQAQLAGSVVESSNVASESLLGRDLSQLKAPLPNSAPLQGILTPVAGQVDGATSVKMAAGPAMTMNPGGASWNNEFAVRVSTVVKNGLQEASLQLNPPELGRLDVKISTDGDQAKILFNVQNIAAKDAIEQAMPRLREMLEESGLQLAQSDVADQSSRQHAESDETTGNFANSPRGTMDESPGPSSIEMAVVSSDALVDYYI